MDRINLESTSTAALHCRPAKWASKMRQTSMGSLGWALWGCLLFLNLTACGQEPLPPPGFTPTVDNEPVPGISTEPQIFTGSTEESSVSSYPNRTRNTSGSQTRYGRFPATTSASLFEATEPPFPRVWFTPEAILWWTKGSPVPLPLVTRGSLDDDLPGAIGQPNTSVVLGNQNVGLPGRWGGRFTFGFSVNPEQTWAVEGTYFFLPDICQSQGVSSTGSPHSGLLTFPFYNPVNSTEDSSAIALPGSFAGRARMTVDNFLQGTDVNLTHNILRSGMVRVDLLGGFRYLNLEEDLYFATDSPNAAPNPPGFFHTFDQFSTSNNFYGGQVGVRASVENARFFANATGKLALGSTVEQVWVDGGTYTNIGGYASAPGGYLSQPTNLGSATHSQFAVLPELNLNVGVRLAPWVSVTVGYSFLYLSSVARPGNQPDHVINPTQSSAITSQFPASLSGPARPGLNVEGTSFWAQGLNFSLEFRF